MKTGFKSYLDSHNNIHASSLLTIIPIYPDFGVEKRYINKTLKEMATIYARLVNQYEFNYHSFFSTNFYRINEEDQRSDETEFFTNLNTKHNLTETDIDNIDVKSQLEHQIQIRKKTKESGCMFDRNNTLKIGF